MIFGAAVGQAASSGFLLGLDYSEWAQPNAQQIATDNSGSLYILYSCTNTVGSPSCITKLTGNGQMILWQNALGFIATSMVVDPNGGVYATPAGTYGETPAVFVEKLTADGAGIAWKTPIGFSFPSSGGFAFLAVDASGRAFVAGDDGTANGDYVVRLNAAGSVDYTTHITGAPATSAPAAIAVNPTGSEVVVVGVPSFTGGFSGLVWLTPDSGEISYSSFTQATNLISLAVAPNGDALVYGSNSSGQMTLQRIGSAGTIQFSEVVFQASIYPPFISAAGLAVDAAGNAYVAGYSAGYLRPVKNSLATCADRWLSVIAPDGSILQTTYTPTVSNTSMSIPLIATGPSGTFLWAGDADPTVPPTQAGPIAPAQGNAAKLFHLSPNPNAQTFPLACAGNAASYFTGSIAAGELVTLFGNGLGPQQGVQTEATTNSPFPTQVAGVQVMFDGTPAPLLWVQDAQINLAAPWSVTGPNAQVCVSYNNVTTNCLTLPVVPAAPGVFTVDGAHAAALNQDGSINSAANPAAPGSIVSIFATGPGPITPPQADGSLVEMPLPVNELPVSLFPTCTEIPCGVLNVPGPPIFYAGPAPYLIAGASQINFQATPLPLSLSVGGTSTPAVSNSFTVYVGPQPPNSP
jgi:uncharacterized protein (TIGR03437 family)